MGKKTSIKITGGGGAKQNRSNFFQREDNSLNKERQIIKFIRDIFNPAKNANKCVEIADLFRLCPPPELSGCILFAPPDARAIFLHNDLLSNDTCSVTGERITY